MSSHDHDDGHSHYDSPLSRRRRSEMELRAMALEAALVEKGLVATDAIDEMVEYMEQRIGPHHGARVVAFDDLGMEAVREFDVKDMPVTVAVDASGNAVHESGPREWRAKIGRIAVKVA